MDDVSFTKTLEGQGAELQTGTTFAGRYRIIEGLGSGGMGKVYKVFDTEVKEKIALKLLRPEIAADEATIERFRNELKLARRVRHPRICQMFDLGQEQGAYFITMEYVPGEDLKRFLRQSRTLSIGTAVCLARQVAEGLAEAHKAGVVHRDLKPSNIMIDREGDTRVMDFGIARSLESKKITGAGAMIGTPEYMSPEQVEGRTADARADIYALGVILFEMVAGRPPFEGETAFSIANMHRSEPAPDPRSLNPQVPVELSRLILRCLEKDREKRFRSAEELIAGLAAVEGTLPKMGSALSGRSATSRKAATSKTITVKITPRKLVIPALVVFAGIVLVIGLTKVLPRREAPSPAGAGRSVAVLPFVDLSPDQGSEHLADGISDALINALSRLRGLRVPGRTSAFTFKGQETDAREIGQKLNVETVLEGSVQVVGGRLRVMAQLINAEDGFQLWSDKYDRTIEDLIAVQDDIARAIVETLEIEILGDKSAPLVKADTTNPEAYNLYLRGRYFRDRRGKDDFQRSFEYFEKALAIDPNYALAYAGLGDAYRIYGGNLFCPPAEAYPKARAAVLKALELDDDLAEAYAALGGIKRDFDWDFDGAERDFQKAIELSSGDSHIHHQYAVLLSILGRYDEAVGEVKLARDLDPLAPRVGANVGWLLYCARRYDESLRELKRAIEFDPGHWATYEYFGYVYCALGRYEESEDNFRMGMRFEDHQSLSGGLAVALARAGRTSEARKLVDGLNDRAGQEYVSPAMLAASYGALGELDTAFSLLERGFSGRDIRMTYLKMEPLFDSLCSDPRFGALLRRIGLSK